MHTQTEPAPAGRARHGRRIPSPKPKSTPRPPGAPPAASDGRAAYRGIQSLRRALHRGAASAIAAEIEALLRIREEAEATALYLIAELDAIDGDADLEPSLGCIENHPTSSISYTYFGERCRGGFSGTSGQGNQERWSAGNILDLEAEHDGREDDGDDREPTGDENEASLGSLNIDIEDLESFDQTNWIRGGDRDRELDAIDMIDTE